MPDALNGDATGGRGVAVWDVDRADSNSRSYCQLSEARLDPREPRRRLTLSMTLENRTSLKYWLEDPRSTRTSSLDRSPKSADGMAVDAAFRDGELLGSRWTDRASSTAALASDRSRPAMRDDMSAMRARLVRRTRGPAGGKVQSRPARAHAAHDGAARSHRIFLLLQPWQDRGGKLGGCEVGVVLVGDSVAESWMSAPGRAGSSEVMLAARRQNSARLRWNSAVAENRHAGTL